MDTPSLHRHVERTLHAEAPPDAVFPLLCPVRERAWVDGWDADVLHSDSGVAELGCVFVARQAGAHAATFVVTRHEPPRRIEFAIFHGDRVETLAIALSPTRGGTDMTWTRRFTALSPSGAAWIEAHVPNKVIERLVSLEAMMYRFLASR